METERLLLLLFLLHENLFVEGGKGVEEIGVEQRVADGVQL